MRRAVHISILIVLVLALVCWMRTDRSASRQDSTTEGSGSSSDKIPIAAPATDAAPVPHAEAPRKVPPIHTSHGGITEQRAFRFVLNSGKLQLEAVEDIRGDFHPRRGRAAWQPGMLCCRLLDEQQRVLAEETVPAPDHVCVVLDPNTPGLDGSPQPAMLSPTGPLVFQVRLPKMESATQMKVYRLAGTQPAGLAEEPLGQLLATIPLNR